MDAVTGFEGAGPIGRVDVFVCGARWRNEASGNRSLWSRLCKGRFGRFWGFGRFSELRICRNEPTIFLELT
jgi:hypothetical protein